MILPYGKSYEKAYGFRYDIIAPQRQRCRKATYNLAKPIITHNLPQAIIVHQWLFKQKMLTRKAGCHKDILNVRCKQPIDECKRIRQYSIQLYCRILFIPMRTKTLITFYNTQSYNIRQYFTICDICVII